MRVRPSTLGATLLSIAAGTLTAGCGTGEPAKQAAIRRVADTAAPSSGAAGATQRVGDPEAAQSFALPGNAKLTKKPPAPGAAKTAVKRARRDAAAQATQDTYVSPGAPSDAQIAAELRQMQVVQRQQAKATGNVGGQLTLQRDGTVSVSASVPEIIARVVDGANAIAKYPYVYGGGHGSFVDTAYDCSGSLSYALAAGGLLNAPKTSGDFASSGAPGPGKWITIYANAGHTFMVVGGIRYDTSGRGGPLGTRWQTAPRSIAGFTVRHPPGL